MSGTSGTSSSPSDSATATAAVQRGRWRRIRLVGGGTLALLAALPASGAAQSRLGLSAAAAIGVRGGGGRVERDVGALEGGAELDFGHFASRRLRLVTGIAYMRSFDLVERVETEGVTYRDVFYDLSGRVGINWFVRTPDARIVPYLGGGLSVHALSSSFKSLTIDTRYNSNNFGVQASGGLRIRTGARHAVVLEAARIQVRNVSRSTVQIGIDALFNDLARKRR